MTEGVESEKADCIYVFDAGTIEHPRARIMLRPYAKGWRSIPNLALLVQSKYDADIIWKVIGIGIDERDKSAEDSIIHYRMSGREAAEYVLQSCAFQRFDDRPFWYDVIYQR